MKVKIPPQNIMSNFLRNIMTDVNSSRSGNWIYPDWPRIDDLGDTSFPRISVIMIDSESQPLGLYETNSWDTCTLQIDIWTKKGLLFTRTVTDEAVGTMASTVNSDRFAYVYLPSDATAVTNIKHNGSAYGTVTAKLNDAAFTAPGSLAAGTVEWSRETGNLNFSAADVSSHNGEAITSTYTIDLEGAEQVRHLAYDVVRLVKNNWRTNSTFEGLYYPLMINGPVSVPFEEELGVYRYQVTYQVNGYNLFSEGL